MEDDFKKATLTGMYINTNKTADNKKNKHDMGYEIPWQFEEALRWYEKLRNWQEKYNPITTPMPWTSLENKHLGANKSVQP